MITHISGAPKQVMREGLDSRPRESSNSLPNSSKTTEQDVKNELGGSQDQGEDTAHSFHYMDPQIFDIQALLLIEAIAMFPGLSVRTGDAPA